MLMLTVLTAAHKVPGEGSLDPCAVSGDGSGGQYRVTVDQVRMIWRTLPQAPVLTQNPSSE